MGVTTVSPSPASPTEGEDLCEIDVTKVAIHIVTLLINLCGLLGNGAVLFILKCCNTAIFALAFADFLFLLLAVPSTLLFLVEDMSCSPIMPLPYVNFLFHLSVISLYWALFRVMLRSNMVYMFIICTRCCRCVLPKRWLSLVICVQYVAFCIFVILSPTVTNLCSSQLHKDCRAFVISIYALTLLYFTAFIVISSKTQFIKAKLTLTEQQPERRNIIIFLMVLFILILSLCNFLQQLGYTIASSDIFFLLNCIHSSIKSFIYFLAGGFQRPCSLRSLRLSLLRVFDDQENEAAHSDDAPMETGV